MKVAMAPIKTIVVLGMGRSATSLVAKALSHEIFMGDKLLPPAPDNPHGFFENTRFVELNDAILAAAGGSWSDPPPEKDILGQSHRFNDRIRELIREEQREPLWGWKDPRTALTIRLYVPHLTNPHFVCCFRDPHDVALSLRRRNGFSIEKGIALARNYNRRIIEFLSDCHLR